MKLARRRVTLHGLGRHGGGVAAARYLAACGAELTVTDLSGPAALADSLDQLRDLPNVCWRLGEHRVEDFQRAELLVVNPAVRPGDRFVALARRAGARITSEIELFLEACPAPVTGVTGSNGKSSTAAMLAGILARGGRTCWLGGNNERSLFPLLERIQPGDEVVLELSSFQLAWLSAEAKFPQRAVVTGCTPNHLDWHGSWADYVAAKQRLVAGAAADGFCVLNDDDPEVAGWGRLARARRIAPSPPRAIPPLGVAGRHQRGNARLAAAAAAELGCSAAAISTALSEFRGLPHRLEPIGQVAGRHFYDDSQATTPESTIAALATFSEPVWLLAGGQAKGASLDPLARAIAGAARGAACFGACGCELAERVARVSPTQCCRAVATLAEGLAWIWPQTRPGDVVLLSPAAASFDQFRDYAQRAAHFRAAVAALEKASPARR